jgi:hypothetical protein
MVHKQGKAVRAVTPLAKQFHIISTGTSLLKHAQKPGGPVFAGEGSESISDGDQAFWKQWRQDATPVRALLQFLAANPYERSAEMNTFLRAVANVPPERAEVY